MTSPPSVVVGVDGGNSKTDLVLCTDAGAPLAYLRGPSISHQVVAMPDAVTRFRTLLDAAQRSADLPAGSAIAAAAFCLAGADSAADIRRLREAFEAALPAVPIQVLNDSFGILRAGTDRGWGVALICGAGVNATAVTPDGRVAGLAALGDISGDWGGGSDLGLAALGAAVRARDGRGPRTALEHAVPAHFGLKTPAAVTGALYRDELDATRLRELSPVVFAAAAAGDAVARQVVDRLADELATMAGAVIRRLHLARTDAEVVLGGGVFATDDRAFYARLADRLHATAPRARITRLEKPPVLGAALLALDEAGSEKARQRLRREMPLRPAMTSA
jgi:N-acetylglucosamine kinase-like BadF-type ATPase